MINQYMGVAPSTFQCGIYMDGWTYPFGMSHGWKSHPGIVLIWAPRWTPAPSILSRWGYKLALISLGLKNPLVFHGHLGVQRYMVCHLHCLFFRSNLPPHLCRQRVPVFAEVDEWCEFRGTCGDDEANEADANTTRELGKFHLPTINVQG